MNLFGCVVDDQQNVCYWNTVQGSCKKKACSDIQASNSIDCSAALENCVSNGSYCIEKTECSKYTTYESCSAGGTNGQCAFTPSPSSQKIGTCKLFQQCADASNDKRVCQAQSASCKWIPASGSILSSCINHTCNTAANGSAKCISIPSLNGNSYTVCTLLGGKCVTGDATSLTQSTCFQMSKYTYTWSTSQNKCISCGATPINNGEPNSTRNNSNSTTNFGILISILLIHYLLIQ